jgi:8-oxo-dGTP diphosphatase
MEKDKKIIIRARAIILHEGAMLVVKHRPNDQYVALPGGHLEWGETIKECMSREIVEELGVKPEIGRLLYINNFIEKDTVQSIEFFFEITNGQDYKNLENLERTHAFEIHEIRWITPTDSLTLLPKPLWEDFKAGKILSDEIRYLCE